MATPKGNAILECLRGVSRDMDADIYVISGGLYEPLDDDVLDDIAKLKTKKKNALLLLTTFGGSADVAYRIARGFQRAYEKNGEFIVLISGLCKSAGTLLAIGASRLVMTDNAQLGPLDVQLSKPDAIGEMMSGLTPCQSLAFLREHAFELFEYCFLELLSRSNLQITTRTATEIASKLVTGLFDPVYAHLDPMRLGEYHRDMMVAAEYGKRLDKGSLAAEGVLRKLTHGYPSHGFIIDREEAKDLFKNVDEPTAGQIEMLEWLMPQIRKDLYHQDATKRYVGVSYVLNLDIDLTPEETPEKEVSTDGKEPDKQSESAPAEQRDNQSEGAGSTEKDTRALREADAYQSRTTDGEQATEVVEQVKKGRKHT